MLPLCPASGFLTALACCLPPSPATGQPNKAPCLLQKVGQGTVNTVPLNLPPSRRHQSHPPGGSVFTPKHKAAPPLTAAREQCLCKKSFCANTPKTAMAFCSCCFCHRHCSLVITSLAPALLSANPPIGTQESSAPQREGAKLAHKEKPPHIVQREKLHTRYVVILSVTP